MSPINAILEAVVAVLKAASPAAGLLIYRHAPAENSKRPFLLVSSGGQDAYHSHSGEYQARTQIDIEALTLADASEISHAARLALEASDAAPVAISGNHSVAIRSISVESPEAEQSDEDPSTLSQHQERRARTTQIFNLTYTFKLN